MEINCASNTGKGNTMEINCGTTYSNGKVVQRSAGDHIYSESEVGRYAEYILKYLRDNEVTVGLYLCILKRLQSEVDNRAVPIMNRAKEQAEAKIVEMLI